MPKKLILILLTISTLLLFSCSKKTQNLSGTWIQHGKDNSYTFYEDGTGVHERGIQKNDISYKTEDQTITIYDKNLWLFDSTQEYFFEIDGNTLKLTDGVTTMVFSRYVAE